MASACGSTSSKPAQRPTLGTSGAEGIPRLAWSQNSALAVHAWRDLILNYERTRLHETGTRLADKQLLRTSVTEAVKLRLPGDV